ncbi:unnamed protein product [Peniophora sp. CBMAI 1063]|nr:unnamed protein product [Peniophora sp. CBMAI 1063]
MDVVENNKKNIRSLRIYLAHLPNTLPEPPAPQIDLRHFAPKVGVLPGDKAVDEALQEIFGISNNTGLTIRERGPGIQALADVLEQFLQYNPASLPLQRWLYGALLAASNVYRSAGIAPPSLDPSPVTRPSTQAGPSTSAPPSHDPSTLQLPGTTSSANLSGGTSSQPTNRHPLEAQSSLGGPGSAADPYRVESQSTTRTIKPEPPPRAKGKRSVASERQVAQGLRRAKSIRHSSYVFGTITQDPNLRQLVQSLSTTKSCLRSRSYAIRKLPWHSPFMTEDTLLGDALLRTRSTPETAASSSVTETATSSAAASVNPTSQQPILTDLARRLDTWERDDVYSNVDRACIDFRWMGIEPEGAVSLAAHEFMEIGLARVEDYQWLIALRSLDVLAWACGTRLPSRSHAVPRRDGTLLSTLLSPAAPNTPGWATYSSDWVLLMSGPAEHGAVRSAYTTILSQNALAQFSTLSWNDDPCKVPGPAKVNEALPNMIKEAMNLLPGDHFRRDFIAAHNNLRLAATGLGYILHKCGPFASSNIGDQLLDITKLKDYIVAAQWEIRPKAPALGLSTKDFVYPLAVALFVSPVFLFSKAQLVKNARPASELFETWKLLGNTDRPAALMRVERDIWRLLLRVLDGVDLTACLLSFIEHWRRMVIAHGPELFEAKTWFKPGPLPTEPSTPTSGALESVSFDQASQDALTESGEPNTPRTTGNACGPGNKRPADSAETGGESAKRLRLSVSATSQTRAESPASPLTGRASPTPSHDGDTLRPSPERSSIFPPGTSSSSTQQASGSTNSSRQPPIAPLSSESLLATVLAEINQLKAERDALQTEVEPLRVERNQLRTARDDLISRVSAALDRAGQAELRVRELDEYLSSARSQAASTQAGLETALNETRSRAELAEDRTRVLEGERDGLSERLRASEAAIIEHEDLAAARVASLESEWQRVDSERLGLVDDLRKQVQALEADLSTRTNEVQSAQTEKQHALVELDSMLRAAHSLLTSDIGVGNLNGPMAALGAELGRLRGQTSTADERIQAADQRASDAEQRAADANQRATEAAQRAATAEQERAAMEDVHDRRVGYMAILQQRIRELEANSWRF